MSLIEPGVHLLLHAFAARCGDVEAAAQEGRQFAAVAAFGLLHRDRQPLQQSAELQRDEGVQRHVESRPPAKASTALP